MKKFERKQFRMYTLYKSIVDGLHDNVRNISMFRTNGNYVEIWFRDGEQISFLITDFETKKAAVRHINKKLKELRQNEERASNPV